MKAAVEQVFDGSLAQVAIGGAYDATRINRGKHTGQFNLGAGPVDRFVGPAPVGVGNFGETALALASHFLHPIKINEDLWWVFGGSFLASLPRPVQLWTFRPSTNAYSFVGAVSLSLPGSPSSQTLRGFRVMLENYTAGTVSVSGTAVTGSGTAWLTGLSVGSRIGFGSTDPNEITTWYEISAIGSDTSITLTAAAGTIAAGTPYVIQDLMIVQAITVSSPASQGGIYVTKGLQFADFQNPAKAIGAATTVDKIKATYRLRDAATGTNTSIGGCALGGRDSWTQQYVYACDGASTTLKLYRYNIRAPLTPTAGEFTLTGSDIVITGNQTVTGSVSQANNGRVATLQHGPGAGVPSFYLFTNTRILRVPLAGIVNGSTTFVADSMTEVPPGTTNTNLAGGSFTSFDIAGSIDKLVITAASNSGTIYLTDYYTGGQQMDRRAGCQTLQMTSALRDANSPIFLHSVGANTPFVWVEDGWLFYIYVSSTGTQNLSAFSVYPLAADLEFQADVNNRVICPKITLGATAAKLYRCMVNAAQNLGDHSMGVAPDMYRVQVRTSGIDDNSGAWVDVPPNGDLSGLGTPAAIQFGLLFRTAGVIMLPARVLSLALIYETNDALPSQYQWKYDTPDSDPSNGTFGFTQVALFGSSPPLHTINVFRGDTNALVLTQASSGTTNGNFQHWNGSAWVNGLGSDAVGTRRRFVPTGSLPSGVDLYATLTVA
jgi:hypothetical protein